ncbi:MAG: hypothetical protein ACREIV_12420, partial [Planctomycetaceae bacterium]
HHDERGAITLETVLLIGAIVIPILIFILKFGWPKIREYFDGNMHTLEQESEHLIGGGSR